MAEPTTSRLVLRQALARRLRLPFPRRIGDSSVLTGGSTTTAIDTARAVQSDNFWRGAYFYNVTRSAGRYITAFVQSTKTFTLESAIAGQTTGDVYEIHSIWTADDLHFAINSAIKDSFSSFFDYVTDETLVLEENKLSFALSSLTQAPWRLARVFAEWNDTVVRGAATSGAAGSLTDSSLIGGLAGVTNTWKISIYAGTGSGQLRSVASVNNGTGAVAVSVNWTTPPDTTSKYSLWNPLLQRSPWTPLTYGRTDQPEYPDFLHLDLLMPSCYGLRLRLKMACPPSALAADTDTTVIPQEFVLLKALSILYGQVVDDTRLDRQRYAALEQNYAQQAEAYRQMQYFRPPDNQFWLDGRQGDFMDPADPMGWRGLENG